MDTQGDNDTTKLRKHRHIKINKFNLSLNDDSLDMEWTYK
jgi:hypothetical protein